MMTKGLMRVAVLGLAGMLVACGGSDGPPLPDPIEMAQFKLGTTRIDVIGAVGKPEWTVTKEGRPCDLYKLYTRGISSGGKAALAVLEGITGIATLGLAEVAWSGVRAGTRPDMHTVLFCYGQPPDNDALVDIYDKNPTVERPASHTVIDTARYAVPVVLPATGMTSMPPIPALPGSPDTVAQGLQLLPLPAEIPPAPPSKTTKRGAWPAAPE